MKENFNNLPIMGKKLNEKESQEIIKKLREKYPDIDIKEDIEHFIIKKVPTFAEGEVGIPTPKSVGKTLEVTFLKRKFLPTTNAELPKLSIEEALEAEIIGIPEESMFKKVKNLREKNKKEKEAV